MNFIDKILGEDHVRKISYNDYKLEWHQAKISSDRVALNVDIPLDKRGNKYFKSRDGVSYVTAEGELKGLLRRRGSKSTGRLATLHQEVRILAGGTFLNTYEGPLSKSFEKNGFFIVARVPFNPEFADEGWDQDDHLRTKPDIVWLSVYKKDEIVTEDFEYARAYAADQYDYLVRKYVAGRDKTNVKTFSIEKAVKILEVTEDDLLDPLGSNNYQHIGIRDSKNYIVKSKLTNYLLKILKHDRA